MPRCAAAWFLPLVATLFLIDELPGTDLDSNPRNVKGRVDIGAYEFSCQMSGIPPLGTCTITLLFSPTTIGSRRGELKITGNMADQVIELSGMGPPPKRRGGQVIGQ